MRSPNPCLFLALPFLMACGDSPGPSDPFCDPVMARVDSFMATFAGEEPQGERYGGTAVAATVSELTIGLNGFAPMESGALQHQMYVGLMTLIQYGEDLTPIPYLAESWEVADDQSHVTFHLRDDVFWHDGEPTTAHDVAFTYVRVTDPLTGYPTPSFFRYYVGGEEGVEVLDSLTVRFHLDRPHADFMDPWRTVTIMPAHLLEDVPPTELSQHPIGTICPVGNGPFRFVSHTPDDRWVFEANPSFPEGLGGRPYLDRYEYRAIDEHSTLLAEFLTGGVDVYVALLPNHATRLRDDADVQVFSFVYRSFFFAAWNSRIPKLSDPRVRRALTLGTNRRQILEGLREGRGEVANTGVPRTHWAYDPSLADSLAYDPDQARSLLSQAGWEDRDGDGIREDGDGQPLRISLLYNPNQERREVAEIMQAQLLELGVDLSPRSLSLGILIEAITSSEREYEAFLMTFEAEFQLDERDLFHSETIDGRLAFSGTRDSVVDRYLDTLQLVPDREEAISMWQAYQQRIIELQPYTFLYYPDRQNGVSGRLNGVTMDVRGDWQNIREWWISPEDRRTP